MTLRVVLHIGSPKTGTSALQVFLARTRDALGRQGCHYPTNAEVDQAATGKVTSGNAIGLAHFLNPSLRHSVTGDDAMRGLLALLADAPAGCDRILFSSEFLWQARPERLERFGRLLADADVEAQIIAYVRPHDDFVLSQYSQLVKRHHETRTLDEVGREIDMDALAVLDRYIAVFGRGAMTVRAYDSNQFAGGSLVADFSAQLGLTAVPALASAASVESSVNQRLSLQESEVLRRINHLRLPMSAMDRTPAVFQRIRRSVVPDEQRSLTPDLACYLRQTFRDQTRLIERNYLVGQHLPFNAPVSSAPAPPPPGVLLLGRVTFGAAWPVLRRKSSRWWSHRSRRLRCTSGGGSHIIDRGGR